MLSLETEGRLDLVPGESVFRAVLRRVGFVFEEGRAGD